MIADVAVAADAHAEDGTDVSEAAAPPETAAVDAAHDVGADTQQEGAELRDDDDASSSQPILRELTQEGTGEDAVATGERGDGSLPAHEDETTGLPMDGPAHAVLRRLRARVAADVCVTADAMRSEWFDAEFEKRTERSSPVPDLHTICTQLVAEEKAKQEEFEEHARRHTETFAKAIHTIVDLATSLKGALADAERLLLCDEYEGRKRKRTPL
jgi:hypothetical protein